jgi:hypothetical protein
MESFTQTRLQKFLFEDDQELSRAVSGLFGFESSSPRLAERARYAVAIGVFVVLLLLIAELLGGPRPPIGEQFPGSSGIAEMLPQVEPMSSEPTELSAGARPIAASLVQDQNYTMAPLTAFGTEDSGLAAGSNRPRISTGQSSSIAASSGLASGAVASGGGGGGPATQLAPATQSAGVNVPENGNSAVLLAVALILTCGVGSCLKRLFRRCHG